MDRIGPREFYEGLGREQRTCQGIRALAQSPESCSQADLACQPVKQNSYRKTAARGRSAIRYTPFPFHRLCSMRAACLGWRSRVNTPLLFMLLVRMMFCEVLKSAKHHISVPAM